MKTIKNISIDVEVMKTFEEKYPTANFSNWVENKLKQELGLPRRPPKAELPNWMKPDKEDENEVQENDK